ncbi:DNA polymerase III subunit beta [Nitrosophilus kaiyonis]|uniref:DNA polymerase III subunit beta n=1 Tax=Nitrosophilus kaiyonis TaxID=2930200 RepID=UPI002492C7F7|nr:DNA polymerase III subunit beta [Nitrosophilus kaiyonis]
MKISIQKSILEQTLSQMQPFLEKKDTSQITSHIYLEADDNTLTLKGTDYEIGLKTKINDVNVIEKGKATANGKKLLDIVRILKDNEITLEQKDDHLFIKQGHSKFKLPIFDPEEYPTFPSTQNLPNISLNSVEFITSLKKITPAIDTNNPKFELNGALIDIKENLINLVATDTRRLAIVKLKNSPDTTLSLIIPRKAILEIQKLFLENINLFYDETNLIIKSDNYLFFTKLINGKFPDYERIIPNSLKYELNLPKDKMVEAIKQITTISNEIKLTFLKDRIIFKSLSEENIEAQTEIEVQTPFEEKFVMAVNSRFLLDFLNNIDGNNFIMGINESELPFLLKNENFITIIMPIVI